MTKNLLVLLQDRISNSKQITTDLVEAVKVYHLEGGNPKNLEYIYNVVKHVALEKNNKADVSAISGFIGKFAPSSIVKDEEGDVVWVERFNEQFDCDMKHCTLRKNKPNYVKLLKELGCDKDNTNEERWNIVEAAIEDFLEERGGTIFGKVKKAKVEKTDAELLADFKEKKVKNFLKAGKDAGLPLAEIVVAMATEDRVQVATLIRQLQDVLDSVTE